MDDLVRQLLAAWPAERDDAPHPDRIHLSRPHGDAGQRYIRHDGRGLPPPFHRGLTIGNEHSGPNDAAAALLHVVTRTGDLCDQLREVGDRLHEIAGQSRMKVVECMPTSILSGRTGNFFLGVTVRIEMIGHSGQSDVMVEEIGVEGTFRAGWRRITIAAKSQTRRRREAGLMLRTDPVMDACLKRMTAGARERLMKVLLRKPEASREVVGWASGANWNQAALAMEGLVVDPDVETIRVKDGVIIGRIRLSERTTWNAGSLIAKGAAFPDTVLDAMAGRMLKEVVKHPLLPSGITISKAWMDATGAMRIKATYEDVEIG